MFRITQMEPAQLCPTKTGNLNILLAEDNAVNQQLALTLLERRGHSVTLAVTGLEAVAAVQRERFDLVVMDVQMPEMDGLEATRRIRELEGHTGPRIPILALTAYTLDADREACLAAGMDAFLTKPIVPDHLFAQIRSLTMVEAGPDLKQEPAAVHADVFDRDALLDRVAGDLDLQREIVRLFLQDAPIQLDQMRAAVTANNSSDLRRLAHTLKGTASIMHARPTVEASLRLEKVGSSGDLSSAPEALECLAVEVERLLLALEPLAG